MEEKKEYSIVGTVTIGTDEYRDLVEGCVSANNELNDYRRRYWKLETEKGAVDKEIALLKEQLADYKAFLDVDPDRNRAFKLWKMEQEDAE